MVKKKKQGEHALSALCRTDTNLDFFHAPPEVPDGDETAFLLSQDKLGQGLLGTRRVPFVFVIQKFFIVILLQIILHDKGPYESQARPWVGGCIIAVYVAVLM